ncbi:MAG: hypothetical protein Q9167_001433 [Letrouitia subvulpina]
MLGETYCKQGGKLETLENDWDQARRLHVTLCEHSEDVAKSCPVNTATSVNWAARNDEERIRYVTTWSPRIVWLLAKQIAMTRNCPSDYVQGDETREVVNRNSDGFEDVLADVLWLFRSKSAFSRLVYRIATMEDFLIRNPEAGSKDVEEEIAIILGIPGNVALCGITIIEDIAEYVKEELILIGTWDAADALTREFLDFRQVLELSVRRLVYKAFDDSFYAVLPTRQRNALKEVLMSTYFRLGIGMR